MGAAISSQIAAPMQARLTSQHGPSYDLGVARPSPTGQRSARTVTSIYRGTSDVPRGSLILRGMDQATVKSPG